MRVTREQIQRARKTNLYDYLLKHHADSHIVISHCVHPLNNKSLSIKNSYSGYLDFATGEKGNSVDYLTKYLNYSLQNAVLSLLNESDQSDTQTNFSFHSRTDFKVPPPGASNARVIEYLTKERCISAETVDKLIKMGILYQDKNNNCVFLNQQCDFAEIRGTSKKAFHGIAKNSRPDGFWYLNNFKEGKADLVYICESAIDAISLYELINENEKKMAFVSIAGVAKQQTIDRLKRHKKCIIAVDNDEAGQRCRNINADCKSYAVNINFKDFNEELQYYQRNGGEKKSE